MQNDFNHILQLAQELSVTDFSYQLPDERIARYPLEERDQSKLLVWHNSRISDHRFTELPELLPPHSLLIFNNTRVIRARLLFTRSTGARIEIFCLDPEEPADYQLAFQQTASCSWNCLIGNQKKWKGEVLEMRLRIDDQPVILNAELTSRKNGKNVVRFSWDQPAFEFSRIIEAAGILPIPPYLNRETEQSDLERYQTVYSKIKGSVAAPTAGLHFTDRLFQQLHRQGHHRAELTLHVGAGTFRPVKSETIGGHDMHSEQLYIHRELLRQLLHQSGKRIAVGTTSIRTLESIYWLGVQVKKQPEVSSENLRVSQWEPYEQESTISADEALHALMHYMDLNRTDHLSASTQIIIAPGYRFRLTDGMITNFHQPQSTLLLLISAFLGNDWHRVYQHALRNDYRFLSYGDSNLYLKS